MTRKGSLIAMAAALSLATPAMAGSGPWVLGRGDQSLYVGLDSQRIDKLIATIDGERQVIDVDARITTFTAKAGLTYGLGTRVEVEGWVPWSRAWVARDDLGPCGALGLGECRTTQGVGVIEGRLKLLLVDELTGSPVSVATGAHARFGGLTHETRARLTNLGEGTTDLGGFVSVGRIGGLGSGYWSGHLDVTGLYRIPNTRTFPQAEGDLSAPGSDFQFASDVLFAPMSAADVSFGPSVSVYWRPFGLDFGEVDASDPDRFGALRVLAPRVGGKIIVRDGAKAAFSASVLQTVAPVNNPNTFTVSMGISLNGLFTKDRS
ncbi:MAG: hypothetical protein EP330_01420 [Deltaproteobacteria bacterium]|nr:MAG: hypothetical protein EP330_01420 [Deltaproteobacteria bacterium]